MCHCHTKCQNKVSSSRPLRTNTTSLREPEPTVWASRDLVNRIQSRAVEVETYLTIESKVYCVQCTCWSCCRKICSGQHHQRWTHKAAKPLGCRFHRKCTSWYNSVLNLELKPDRALRWTETPKKTRRRSSIAVRYVVRSLRTWLAWDIMSESDEVVLRFQNNDEAYAHTKSPLEQIVTVGW